MRAPEHQFMTSSVNPDTLAALRSRCRARRAFTLTELLVAVAVLVGVLLAVGKIFSTTGRVTSVGTATSDVMQEIAAIERQIRSDFANLSSDSVFAIRCVAIPNDLYPGRLLNPNLPAGAFVRSDQMVYFTNGLSSVQTYKLAQGSNKKGQGTTARVNFGHAFQLGPAGLPVNKQGTQILAHDVAAGQRVFPWSSGGVDMVRTVYSSGTTFSTSSASPAQLTLVDPRQWMLIRQPVALVNDGGDASTYLGQVLSARSLFLTTSGASTPEILGGRVDAAATRIADVRRELVLDPTGALRPWRGSGFGASSDQYSLISSELMFYPRAERYPPSAHRVDQALSNHILGSAVSSVRIDWTWADGTGEVRDRYESIIESPSGLPLTGVTYVGTEQPWFGLPDARAFLASGAVVPDPTHVVSPYGDDDFVNLYGYRPAGTVFSDNIETVSTLGAYGFDDVMVYEAIFGFNQDEPLDSTGEPHVDMGYTPWPTAVRVTLTVHDPQTTLENGREVQFTVGLPRRR